MRPRVFFPVILGLVVFALAGNVVARDEAFLGVRLQPLTVDIKEAMGLDQDLKGVLINEVIEDSPAKNAGLMKGDVIVKIDEEPVRTVSGASRLISDHSPGDEVEIEIVREGKHKTLEVTLGEREAEPEEFFSAPVMKRKMKMMFPEKRGYLGVRVEDISDELGDYFDVDEGEGVLVLEVMEDSPAEDAGLKPGDVILKVDDDKISDREDLIETVREHDPGERVEITYKRKRRTRTVEVELDKAPREPFRRMFGEREHGRCMMRKSPLRCYIKAYKLPEDFEDWAELPDVEDMLEDVEVYEIDVEDLQEQIEDLRDEIEELREELQKFKE